ncbi:PP2C family protein-serine/threonine phosphatase [Streptomyces minutiscleroticus]
MEPRGVEPRAAGTGDPRWDHGREAERQRPLRVRGRSVAWLPPLLLLLAIAVLDGNTSGEFRIISWIVLVPGIAAAICGVAGTAVFAALSLLTYVEVDRAWPHQYQTGLPDFILVAAGSALAVMACAVRVRGERRMLHMRDVAETTRRTVLRPLPDPWAGLDHAGVYLAADSEAHVGGDFYDIQPSPYGTRVLLGDVQGKGLGAVEAAAAVLGTFREAGHHEPDLAAVAERLEQRMIRHRHYLADLAGEPDAGTRPGRLMDRFATAVLVGFPPAGTPGGHVDVVTFGHEPPLVAGPRGVRALPPGERLPLGLGDLVAGAAPVRPQRVSLAQDETLLLFTDGVTEARNASGDFFPLHERLAAAVAAHPRAVAPAPLVRLVRDAVLGHAGGRLADDTTLFAVRRTAARPAAGRGDGGAS